MVDFSAVEMPITAPGADQVLQRLGQLDARGQAVVANLGKAGQQAASQVAGTTDAVTASTEALNSQIRLAIDRIRLLAQQTRIAMADGRVGAIATFRQATAETQAWMMSVGATEHQMMQLERATAQVDAVASYTGRRLGMVFLALTTSISAMADSTDDSWGRALGHLLGQASAFAMMMGPEGQIVGAVAALDVAIWNHFDHIIQKFDDAMKKGQDAARQLIKTGDAVQISHRMGELYSGDIGAAEGTPEAAGIEKLRARLAQLRQQLAMAKSRPHPGGTIAGVPQDVSDLEGRIDALTRSLLPLETEYNKYLAVWNHINAKLGDAAKTQLDMWRDAEAHEEQLNRMSVQEPLAFQQLSQHLAEIRPQVTFIGEASLSYTEQLKLQERGLLGLYYSEKTTNEQRLQLLQKIIEIEQKLHAMPAPIAQPKLVAPELLTPYEKSIAQAANKIDSVIRNNFGTMLGETVRESFAHAFDGRGLDSVFKSFGSIVMAGIGHLMEQQGEAYLEYGLTVTKLLPALGNPITSGPAAIAAGLALIALGSALSASVGGHGHGGGGGYGGGGGQYNAIVDTRTINPAVPPATSAGRIPSKAPVTVHATIIGKDDPQAQRQIMELIARAQRRGSTSG